MLIRAGQISLSQWSYLATASIELLVARVRLVVLPPAKILRELQDQSLTASDAQSTGPLAIDVERLSWAITAAARYVPCRSDCLIQAVAANRWMRRHKLVPKFYLGVAKDEQGDFAAHAWLRYRDLTVTGGKYDRFSTLIEPAPK